MIRLTSFGGRGVTFSNKGFLLYFDVTRFFHPSYCKLNNSKLSLTRDREIVVIKCNSLFVIVNFSGFSRTEHKWDKTY